MRRASIVLPLLLIALGVVFLINNLRPDLSLFSMIAGYWPYLLIGWGLLRLVEVVVSSLGDGPVRTRGMSGGEWVLVAVVITFGCTVDGAMGVSRRWNGVGPFRINGMEWFGQPYDYTISEQRRQIPRTAHVVIDNLRGNARIVGAEGDQLVVSGRKTIHSLKQGDADEADKQTPVDITIQGDRILIRTNQERVSGEKRITEDLDITIPRGASVEGRGRYGDFDINDITGEVDIDSDNAGVRVQNIGGRVRVDTRNSDIIRASNVGGGVEVKGRGQNIELESIKGPVIVNGSYSGDLEFRNLEKPFRFDSSQTQIELARLPGEVRMSLGDFTATDAVGPFRIISKSKDIHLTNITESVEVDVKRGDIELNASKALPKLNLRTFSGNIDVGMPTAAKFQIQADARRGEIENDFGGGLKVNSEGRGASLNGSTGPGPLVRLESARGTITVRKASDVVSRVAPPAPPEPIAPPKPPRVPRNPPDLKVQTQ